MTLSIDGHTQLTGIIGCPIHHTLSPIFQNAAFRRLKLNWVYVPLLVAPDDLEAAVTGLKALNFRGLNVTMPHKQAIVSYLDEVDRMAGLIGATNTIEFRDGRLIGHNTDGEGFLASLAVDAGFEPAGKRALVVGAGGAARSVTVALAAAGLGALTIINRTRPAAEALAAVVTGNFPGCRVAVDSPDADLAAVFSESDLVVNATSVGMAGNPGIPIPTKHINKKHVIYDIIYSPAETELLKSARDRGAGTVNGVRMLLYQGAAAFKIWTGRDAPLDEMSTALEEAIAKNL